MMQIVPTDLYKMVSDSADESVIYLGDMMGQILDGASTITATDLKAGRTIEKIQDINCNYCRFTAMVPSDSLKTFRDTADSYMVNLNSLIKITIRKYYNLL